MPKNKVLNFCKYQVFSCRENRFDKDKQKSKLTSTQTDVWFCSRLSLITKNLCCPDFINIPWQQNDTCRIKAAHRLKQAIFLHCYCFEIFVF